MVIKGYKGFDKGLKCRGFQYEVGGEYEESDAEVCKKGFHFCEDPFDVFRYYSPLYSQYCLVEGSGKLDKQTAGGVVDSKVSCTKLKVLKEIKLKDLILAGVKRITSKVPCGDTLEFSGRAVVASTHTNRPATNETYRSIAASTGDNAPATSSYRESAAVSTGTRSITTCVGDWSVATCVGNWSVAASFGKCSVAGNTGFNSSAVNFGRWGVAASAGLHSAAVTTDRQCVAANSGDYSTASVEGSESIAVVTGYKSKAKGALGCWLVLAERCFDEGGMCSIIDVKCVKVDGEKIKADTYYMLRDGKFVEVE